MSLDQLAEAQRIASVCLQNSFNIANRADEAVLAATAEQHIADVPPSRSVASRRYDAGVGRQGLGATSMAVAQSWLL